MPIRKVNSNRTPIYRDTGFNLGSISSMRQAFIQEKDEPHIPESYIYSRYRNPTVVAVEEQLAEIEGSEWALLSQSGLAAIDIALSLYHHSETRPRWAFFSEIYGGTRSYIDSVLVRRRGIEALYFAPDGDTYSTEAFERFMHENRPTLVFMELIANPMLIVADLPALIGIAKRYNAAVIVDNTFATPYLTAPLSYGADLVIHSVTKYLSGHGNLTAGAICGNSDTLLKEAVSYRKLVGHMLSPDDAYRLSDMLKTFTMRVERQFDNAHRIAQFLCNHPAVERVLYPALPQHPTHSIAKRIFKGRAYGGVVTFDIAGATAMEKQLACNRFIEAVSSRIPLIPTLGDADTILMPVEPVWGDRYPFPGMIRLSVGIENVVDIIGVISKGLNESSING